jgi:hypothetical protein
MIYDAAILRGAIVVAARDHVTNRLAIVAVLAALSAGDWLDRLDAQVQAAGYTPAEARRIVDEALDLEARRRQPPATRPPARARRGPSILTVAR